MEKVETETGGCRGGCIGRCSYGYTGGSMAGVQYSGMLEKGGTETGECTVG